MLRYDHTAMRRWLAGAGQRHKISEVVRLSGQKEIKRWLAAASEKQRIPNAQLSGMLEVINLLLRPKTLAESQALT
jgi:hypothetical protein